MPSNLYDSCHRDVATGAIDFDTDTFYALITTNTYVPDRAAHSKRNQVTNEVSGTGYTAGGVAVTPTVTLDTTLHRTVVTFGVVNFGTLTLSGARHVVYYKRRGGAASADELIGNVDLGSDKSFANESFSVSTSSLRFQS
jgi:hypothetical protein